jgi:hypothetical protein
VNIAADAPEPIIIRGALAQAYELLTEVYADMPRDPDYDADLHARIETFLRKRYDA